MPPGEFRGIIDFLAEHYRIVALDDILLDVDGEADAEGKPRVLITFDDAYRSVYTEALPVLQERNIPAVFFVSAGLIGNQSLSTDNLITYIANRFGLEKLVNFLQQSCILNGGSFSSVGAVLQGAIAPLNRSQVIDRYDAIADHFRTRYALAEEAGLP